MAFENVLLIVIIIGVLLFGAKKLPELSRALGRAQAEFEKGKRDSIREISKEANETAKQNESIFEPKVMIALFDLNATCGSIKNWNE